MDHSQAMESMDSVEPKVEVKEEDLSESLAGFLKTNSPRELYTLNVDLDKKIEMAKESRDQMNAALEDIQAEMEAVQKEQENTTSQIATIRKHIEVAREKLKNAKAEKAAAEQASRQRVELEKNPGITIEQKIQLRDKLSAQRALKEDLEDQIDTLSEQKTEYQATFSEYRSTLKQRKDEMESMEKDNNDAAEKQQYLASTRDDLKNCVEDLREQVQRIHEKLSNPSKDESAQGSTLFDEVTAEKKALETELVTLVEFTTGLRQQIRQKQEELDELESNETEDICIVDTDYVLEKIRKFVNEEGVVREALKKIEDTIQTHISRIEQSVKGSKEGNVELGGQYTNLRDYGMDCMKVVGRECDQGVLKLKTLSYELEQLCSDHMALADRLTRAK